MYNLDYSYLEFGKNIQFEISYWLFTLQTRYNAVLLLFDLVVFGMILLTLIWFI